MKRVYVTPNASVEEFVANEVVSACWAVGCSWQAANNVEKGMSPTNPNNKGTNNFNDGQTHDSAHCGNSGNQKIVTDSNNKPIAMYEINSETGVTNLECTIYSNASYSQTMDISNVTPGMTIYWTTKLSNGTTWYHQGTPQETYPGFPNRS